MGRASTKANKNRYQLAREEAGLTREKASSLMKTITQDRIARIENDECIPQPYDILEMSCAYKKPSLCNYYCSQECAIGKQYVPQVKVKELSAIVLEMLASLNRLNDQKNVLIEITSDSKISNKELCAFVSIQKELENISVAVETLQLWVENMLVTGAIDAATYAKLIKE